MRPTPSVLFAHTAQTLASRAGSSLYESLGLSQNATSAEVRQSYLRLVKQFHPDRGGDPQRFMDVQGAYRALRQPALRARYDYHQSAHAQPGAGRPRTGEERVVWALGCSLLVGTSGMGSAAYWAREKRGALEGLARLRG